MWWKRKSRSNKWSADDALRYTVCVEVTVQRQHRITQLGSVLSSAVKFMVYCCLWRKLPNMAPQWKYFKIPCLPTERRRRICIIILQVSLNSFSMLLSCSWYRTLSWMSLDMIVFPLVVRKDERFVIAAHGYWLLHKHTGPAIFICKSYHFNMEIDRGQNYVFAVCENYGRIYSKSFNKHLYKALKWIFSVTRRSCIFPRLWHTNPFENLKKTHHMAQPRYNVM